MKPKANKFAPIDVKSGVNRKMAGSTLETGGMKFGGKAKANAARFSSM